MTKKTREPFWVRCGDTTQQDRRNLMRFMSILMAWAICLLGATFLIKKDLLPAGPIPWAMAALPSVAAIFVVVAYARFLREADELQRAVQLRALAMGFGAGWFAISGYRIFERLGAPQASASDHFVIMALFYSIGSVLGWRRYR